MKTAKEEISGNRRRPRWWKQFWIGIAIAVSVLVVAQCAAYLLGYIDLFKLFGGVLVLLLTTPLVYAVWYVKTRYQHSKTVHVTNKIAFILSGAFLAPPITLFATAFIIWATGLPPPTDYLGAWPTFILLFVVPSVIGAFIGYWVGKRRDYRPFL